MFRKHHACVAEARIPGGHLGQNASFYETLLNKLVLSEHERNLPSKPGLDFSTAILEVPPSTEWDLSRKPPSSLATP